MRQGLSSAVSGYGVAVVATAAAVLLRWLTDSWLGDYVLFAPLLGAVAVAVWYGGYRPALVAIALGLVAYDYLFIEPRGSFSFPRVGDNIAVAIYLFTCAIVIGFGEAMRLAQRRTQEEQERLGTTLASIGDAVIATDAQGRITLMNAIAESLTGWTNAEAVGQPMGAVFRIVNEHTRQPVENPVQKVLELGRIVGLANHTVLIAKDGTERPIDDSAAPIRCRMGEIVGCVLVFRDITERRKAEWALRQSEARKTAMIQAALDCIISIDHTGKIIEFNAAAERTFGYQRDEALGRELVELIIPPSLRDQHRRGMAHYLATGEAAILDRRLQMPAIRADGAEFPVELAVTRISTEGPPTFTAFLRDITERKSAEAALHQSAAALRAKEAELELVVSRTPLLLTRLSRDLRYVFVNRACAEFFGLPAEQIVGRPIVEIMGESAFAAIAPHVERVLRGESVEFESEIPYTHAGRRFMRALYTPDRDERGEVIGWVATVIDVTDRKRTEESLRQSEERFARFMRSLPGLAWVKDLQGRYVYANDAAARVFGCPQDELYGKTDDEVFPPETAAQFKANDEKALASEMGVQSIETLQQEDGVVHHSLVSKFPILRPDGRPALVGGMAIDITERKQAEDELRRAEQRTRSVVDNVVDGIITIDERGVVQSFNPAAERLFGYSASELIGQNVKMLMPEPYQHEHDNYIGNYLRTGDAKIIGIGREVVGRRKDRSTFPMDLAVSEFRVADRRHFTGIVRDITERKRAEEALQVADRRKNEFLATLAHELRNPLAPIRNAVQILLLKGLPDPDLKWSREVIDRQVTHMARLLDDLLDVSRITHNKLELRKERIELAAVVQSAVEASRPLIDSQGQELAVALPPEPVYLDADPVRLSQVFVNLLNNAAKYSAPGGCIRLSGERQGSDVVLSVTDDGIGIAAEMLPRIFDIFSQGQRMFERSQSGLGIGLSLVRGLVELHGGSIEARSEGVGKGSEFIVRLPLVVEKVAEQAAPAAGGEPLRETKRHVLIVDDHKESAETLAMLLKLKGHEVYTAYDGEDALIAAERFKPEVVLLDIGMPKLNGYDACRAIRQQPWSKGMCLIALTGWGQEDDRRRTEEAGFDHHMVKPVDLGELMRLLASEHAEPESQLTEHGT